jgi:polyhydroxybutyrate depolymerase
VDTTDNVSVLKAQRRGAAIVASALGGVIAIAACGSSVAAPAQSQPHSGVQHASITVDGQKRTYRLFLPAGLDATKAAPLVVALTGCPSVGDDMATATHLDDVATSKGFVIVYPDPVNGCWNTGTCCGSAHDTKFIGQLVDKLTAEIRVDKARIFAAGFSAGAVLTYTLACAFSDRFAAIVSDAGQEDGQTCQPARPISVLEIHGTEDTSVLYNYGSEAVQRWVGLDGCPATPTLTVNGITKTSLWNGCRANTVVRFDTVVGGHHQWFGSTFDPIPGEPDSNALMWAFFSGLQPKS